ncbi:MAG TPA: NOP5/NOP56 family protein [Candidatus Nanoarchaeia archaeon]|nr:NOP5/NOP56 family protein [Candidatus Nanoarchaeia archaeon]
MSYYLFKSILGNFVLDGKIKIVDQADSISKLKYKNLLPVPAEKLSEVLNLFRDKKYLSQFYDLNFKQTRLDIKSSVNEDDFIIQTISNIKELDKTCNLLTKRLREWYSLYLPEIVEEISIHPKFVEMVISKTKKDLMLELKIKDSMGADLDKADTEEIILLAQKIKELHSLREKHEHYLHQVMVKYCPNICELAGTTIGAELILLARSLKNLALLPASTIQLLGAEKALFRHLKTGSRSPKYGVLLQHPLVQTAPKNKRGKMSRIVADKLSLCARLDFFKGEFKAKEYRKQLEDKLK